MPDHGRPLAKVTIAGDHPLRVEFWFSSGETVSPVTIYDRRAVETAWKRAGRALDELVQRAVNREAPADGAYLAYELEMLDRAGTALGQILANQNENHFREIRRAFRNWRQLGWGEFDIGRIPVIELNSHEFTYPLELVPLFGDIGDDLRDRSPRDDELLRSAERFVGFTCVVRRMAPNSGQQAIELGNEPTLPIKFMRYRPEVAGGGFFRRRQDESGFKTEQTFLEGSGLLTIDGPWPTDDVRPTDFQQRLVASLFDARRGLLSGRNESVPSAIAHFACHCFTKDRDSEAFELQLSNERGESHSITLEDIMYLYSKQPERPSSAPMRAPIIMNACGSSAMDPWSALSFQDWFLRNQHPTYLGTAAAIPDVIAAKYGEFLYRFLLGGFTLGDAALFARRQLLADSKYPMGLLYVLSGNDQVRVRVPHRELLPTESLPGVVSS